MSAYLFYASLFSNHYLISPDVQSQVHLSVWFNTINFHKKTFPHSSLHNAGWSKVPVALPVLIEMPVPRKQQNFTLKRLWFQGENMIFRSFARKIYTQFHKRVWNQVWNGLKNCVLNRKFTQVFSKYWTSLASALTSASQCLFAILGHFFKPPCHIATPTKKLLHYKITPSCPGTHPTYFYVFFSFSLVLQSPLRQQIKTTEL